MNTVRFALAVIALAILAGCATSPSPYRGDTGYQGSYGAYGGYSSPGLSEGLRTAPCQPFRADALIDWAKELDDGKQHARAASMNVQNGNVSCTQTESAGSRMGQKK